MIRSMLSRSDVCLDRPRLDLKVASLNAALLFGIQHSAVPFKWSLSSSSVFSSSWWMSSSSSFWWKATYPSRASSVASTRGTSIDVISGMDGQSYVPWVKYTSTTLSPDGRVGFLKFSFVKTKLESLASLDIAKEENNNLQNLRFCCCEIEVSSCEKNRSLLLALKY